MINVVADYDSEPSTNESVEVLVNEHGNTLSRGRNVTQQVQHSQTKTKG